MLHRRLHLQAARPSLIRVPGRGPPAHGRLQQSRRATAEAGENKSGHISTNPNEGILFFNNLLPVNLQWLSRYPLFLDKRQSSILRDETKFEAVGAVAPTKVVQAAIENSKLGLLGKVDVVEVLPRLKEGGAYAHIHANFKVYPC